MIRVVVLVALVVVGAEIDYGEDSCKTIQCIGDEYDCVDGRCYCADGYVPDSFRRRCLICPGVGEACFEHCCNQYNNGTLHCWHGICQQCFDPTYGNWLCRASFNEIFLTGAVQIAMASVLVLGILATFMLIYKLCTLPNLRPLGFQPESRQSLGSIQLYVDARLRDAPPRYSRTTVRGAANAPVSLSVACINPGYIHDNSIPPPPYSQEENKSENVPSTNSTLHI